MKHLLLTILFCFGMGLKADLDFFYYFQPRAEWMEGLLGSIFMIGTLSFANTLMWNTSKKNDGSLWLMYILQIATFGAFAWLILPTIAHIESVVFIVFSSYLIGIIVFKLIRHHLKLATRIT